MDEGGLFLRSLKFRTHFNSKSKNYISQLNAFRRIRFENLTAVETYTRKVYCRVNQILLYNLSSARIILSILSYLISVRTISISFILIWYFWQHFWIVQIMMFYIIHFLQISSLLHPNISFIIPPSHTLNLFFFSVRVRDQISLSYKTRGKIIILNNIGLRC